MRPSGILTLGDYSLLREQCHLLKDGCGEQFGNIAQQLTDNLLFPANSVFVPMPSSSGHATYTASLCRLMSALSGIPTMDVLKAEKREQLYLMKKIGLPLPSPGEMGMRLAAPLPPGAVPVIVDNVIATGTTMEEALSVLPMAIPCAVAVDYKMLKTNDRPGAVLQDTITLQQP